jgi:hypothetical protein
MARAIRCSYHHHLHSTTTDTCRTNQLKYYNDASICRDYLDNGPTCRGAQEITAHTPSEHQARPGRLDP